jgi:hypothetical protein
MNLLDAFGAIPEGVTTDVLKLAGLILLIALIRTAERFIGKTGK